MYAEVTEKKRCIRCILPDSFEGVTFNDNGECNYCESYEKAMPLGEDALWEALSLHSRKKTGYDCIVQLSGGKDSTYVLYYAVKKMGLKVAAVNYDSGFQSELALGNMKRACEILDVPLVIHKADFRKRVEILKGLINVGNILGAPMSLCANCENGIRAASRNAAKLYGVGTVLSGQTDFERYPHNPVTGGRYLLKKMANGNLLRLMPHLMRCSAQIAMERAQLYFPSWQKKLASLDASKIHTIYLFDYIPWTCMQPNIVELLSHEVGWEYPGQRVDRFDCVLHPFLCYKWFHETGISWDGYLYSESIRMGVMTREEALTREKRIGRGLKQHCRELLSRSGFSGVALNWL